VAAPEVAVVGGGITGLSCALGLARRGVRVRLYEAREIASGASGRNGGFALRGTANAYDAARAALGAERAARLWRATEGALDELADLAGGAFRRTGSLRLAADEAERDDLRRELDALRADGFAAEWIDRPSGPLARFTGAILHPGDGAFQPARLTRRLAADAAEAGAEIREGVRIGAPGQTDAEHVVVAADGYPSGLLGELGARIVPTRGQLVATAPLSTRLFERPHYARRGFDYWQQLPDGRLVAGGCRDVALADEWTDQEHVTAPVQRALERLLEQLLGARPAITHRWAGIFGSVADRLPLVGRVPGTEGLWVAAGYSGHGNVLGLLCGRLVADALLGEPDPLIELFDPARPGAGGLV
jgi:glycine/D-amino acid oxidase-like deaminating enzyme